jgi:serine phosphatase RsbU (regulator of sigma subunit)
VVADVAGKGMGASLIMASTKAMLPFIAAENSVAATLQILSERLAEDLSPREFVALAFARFSVGDRVVEIANAGLPDPYLLSSEGGVTALEVPGERLPLGARRGLVYESRSWQLGEGDRLLMFSDGLPEARVDGSPLGYEGLAALLPRTDQAASSWIETLFGAMKGETEEELSDDWTALVLHVH